MNTEQLDKDIETPTSDLIIVTELINKLIKENSKTGLSADAYEEKYHQLVSRYEKIKDKQDILIEEKKRK